MRSLFSFFNRGKKLKAENEALRRQLNVYEAGQPSSPRRSWLPSWVRDARYDANSFTRWELTRKIRYFEQNMWLVSKLRELFVKYTIGPNGLSVIPASSDTDWNQRMADSYLEWCENPSLDSSDPMSKLQKLMAGEVFIDGELFILKTRQKLRADRQSIPKIQFIESHRVNSPGSTYGSNDTDNVIDGVEVDPNGRRTGYWVRNGDQSDEWVFRSADDMLHVYEPTRVGMYRGITPFHSTLLTLNDLDDLEAMEMQRAKQAAEIANVVTTWNGELPRSQLRREALNIGISPTSASVPDEALGKRIEMYQTILGSRTIALKPGEDIKQFASSQPSASTQWYWQYKIDQVCAGTGIPAVLVLPESFQGTVVRGVLDDANLFFQSKFQLFSCTAKDIYRFYADWARYNVKGLQDAPADWKKCHIAPPRACNVDVGRNSAAMIAEYAAGLTSLDTIAGSAGTTPDQLTYRKARNIGRVKQIAIEVSTQMGVPILPEEIQENLADIIQKLAQAQLATLAADKALATEEETVDA